MVTDRALLDKLGFRPDAYDPKCPSRVVLDRIGDKWTVLVVGALENGPMRFTALRQRVGGVAPKVLTETLRALERDGVVTRRVYAAVPPRVEYRLTPLGLSLREPIEAIRLWAERHVGDVLDARARFEDAAAAAADAEE
ncbi:MAG TPA: helix-turn-helix domain-containing protein [Solirubrobacteraceae bacterium]